MKASQPTNNYHIQTGLMEQLDNNSDLVININTAEGSRSSADHLAMCNKC
jgi:hypothetical protein